MIDLKSDQNPEEEAKPTIFADSADSSVDAPNSDVVINAAAPSKWRMFAIGSAITAGLIILGMLVNAGLFSGGATPGEQLTGNLIAEDGSEIECEEGEVVQQIPYPFGGYIYTCVDVELVGEDGTGATGEVDSGDNVESPEGTTSGASCPDGTELHANGMCVPIGAQPIISCPDGTELQDDGLCIPSGTSDNGSNDASDAFGVSCPAGTELQDNGQCLLAAASAAPACPSGTAPGAVDGTCIPVNPGFSCPDGSIFNGETLSCDQLQTVCGEIEDKLEIYREEVKQSNLDGETTGEIKVKDYLMHLAIMSSLAEECHTMISEKDAVDCTSKQMFDTRQDKCVPLPGYKFNDGNIVDCHMLDEVLDSIDFKLIKREFTAQEKSALSSLRGTLATSKDSCAAELYQEIADAELSKQKTGGGGAPDLHDKPFELKYIQVFPEEYNPFAGEFRVYFFVTKPVHARMEILDGVNVVKVIDGGKMNAGDRFIAWDGKNPIDGFVPADDYDWRLIVELQAARSITIEADGMVNVVYFDDAFETVTEPGLGDSASNNAGLEDFEVSTVENPSQVFEPIGSQTVEAPLAQNIHAESYGKADISDVGPETTGYMLLLLPLFVIWYPAFRKRS